MPSRNVLLGLVGTGVVAGAWLGRRVLSDMEAINRVWTDDPKVVQAVATMVPEPSTAQSRPPLPWGIECPCDRTANTEFWFKDKKCMNDELKCIRDACDKSGEVLRHKCLFGHQKWFWIATWMGAPRTMRKVAMALSWKRTHLRFQPQKIVAYTDRWATCLMFLATDGYITGQYPKTPDDAHSFVKSMAWASAKMRDMPECWDQTIGNWFAVNSGKHASVVYIMPEDEWVFKGTQVLCTTDCGVVTSGGFDEKVWNRCSVRS